MRLFADDVVIYIKGKNPKTIRKTLQFHLQHLENWSNATGFQFSTTKTKCALFLKKRTPDPPNLTLFDEQLTYTNTVRFLGMTFDKCLDWKCHIKTLKQSCQNGLNILKTIPSTTWGADFPTMMKLYRALIRSKLDYGCTAYGSAKSSV